MADMVVLRLELKTQVLEVLAEDRIIPYLTAREMVSMYYIHEMEAVEATAQRIVIKVAVAALQVQIMLL
jgi:hypothetical protein